MSGPDGGAAWGGTGQHDDIHAGPYDVTDVTAPEGEPAAPGGKDEEEAGTKNTRPSGQVLGADRGPPSGMEQEGAT